MTINQNHRNKTVEVFLLEGRRINKAIQRHFLNVIKASPEDEIKRLTLTQALMLLLIFRAGKATMHELADQMDIGGPVAPQPFLVVGIARSGQVIGQRVVPAPLRSPHIAPQ